MTGIGRTPHTPSVNTGKSNYKLIKDAYASLNKRKFDEAIPVLEHVLSSGTGDIYVLLLLSVAYLHTNQFGKLARFITKMKQMDAAFVPLLQMEAFLKLKSASGLEEALHIYLELETKYPGEPHFHRGRDLIARAKDFTQFQKNARLLDFVNIPRPPRRLENTGKSVFVGTLGKKGIKIHRSGTVSLKTVGKIGAIIAAACLAALVIAYAVSSGYPGRLFTKTYRPPRDTGPVDMITLSGTEYDIIKNMRADRVRVFYKSIHDMTEDFNRARRLIKSGEYNRAVTLLNGIMNSNVNYVVKEKADFLIKFVINSEDRVYEDIPCRSVIDKKYLYRGYAVRWRGVVTRIKERDESQVFTLRVDGAEAGGDADVFSRRIVKGLVKGSRVEMEGVIVDFMGQEKNAYIVSNRIIILPR